MISNLFQLLDQHYEGFSKTYRIICDYVRSNYLDLSYLSIVELSRKIDVSVGSITGFCKAIGFARVRLLSEGTAANDAAGDVRHAGN